MNEKRPFKGNFIVVLISTIIVGYFVWYFYTDYSYWMRRYPRDMAYTIQSNKKIIDAAALAIERYYQEHGYAPSSLSDLVSDPIAYRSWLLLTDDSWGRPIGYSVSVSGTTTVIRIWSYGCDGKPGGEGPAADLYFEWQPNKTNTTNKVKAEGK